MVPLRDDSVRGELERASAVRSPSALRDARRLANPSFGVHGRCEHGCLRRAHADLCHTNHRPPNSAPTTRGWREEGCGINAARHDITITRGISGGRKSTQSPVRPRKKRIPMPPMTDLLP